MIMMIITMNIIYNDHDHNDASSQGLARRAPRHRGGAQGLPTAEGVGLIM